MPAGACVGELHDDGRLVELSLMCRSLVCVWGVGVCVRERERECVRACCVGQCSDDMVLPTCVGLRGPACLLD